MPLLYADRTARRVVDWIDGSFGLEGEEDFRKLYRLNEPHGKGSLVVASRSQQAMPDVHIRAANEVKAASKFSGKFVIQRIVNELLDSTAFVGIFLPTDHLPTQE